ncbi:hypothetical protein D3C78_1704490 [compost metagenome]
MNLSQLRRLSLQGAVLEPSHDLPPGCLDIASTFVRLKAVLKPLSEMSKDTGLPPLMVALTFSALLLSSRAIVDASSFTSTTHPIGRQ